MPSRSAARFWQARPEHTGALAIAAYAHQRLGEFDEALSFYEMLSRLQPSECQLAAMGSAHPTATKCPAADGEIRRRDGCR